MSISTDITLQLDTLDQMVTDWIRKEIVPDIKREDGMPIDIVWAGGDRWVQIKKQAGDNLKQPSVIIKRDPSFRPSEIYIFKNDINTIELYKKINKEQSELSRVTILDVAKMKAPTFVSINYEIILYGKTLIENNRFLKNLFKNLGKTVGVVKGNGVYFDIFFESSINESNILDFVNDNKKVITGGAFRLEGYIIDKSDIKITRTVGRTKLDIKEETVFLNDGQSLDSLII